MISPNSIRFPLWWNHVVLPFTFWIYLVGFRDGVSSASVLFSMSLLLASGSIAALGYLINDFFDQEADYLAGKTNFFNDVQKYRFLVLVGILVSSITLWAFLPTRPITIILLVFEVALFLAYSAPPIRLKNRTSGIIVDALYSRVVPMLTVLSLGTGLDYITVRCSAIWLLIAGLRNILNHQVNDFEGDLLSGQATIVTKYGPSKVRHLLLRFMAPMELLACVLSVALLSNSVSGLFWTLPVFLVFYALHLEAWQFTKWDDQKVEERFSYLLNNYHAEFNNYYADILPAGILVIFSVKDSSFCFLALLHFLIFPNSTRQVLTGLRILISVVVNLIIIKAFLLWGVSLEREKLSAWGYIKRHFRKK